jgi:hypothetical protein
MNNIFDIYSVNEDVLRVIYETNSIKNKKNTLYPTSNNSIFLDLYTLHILIDQTKNEYKVLEHIDLNNFGLLTEYIERLYFVCEIDLPTKKWRIDHVIYNTSHKKAFLIKKVISKTLKQIFNNITFNKQLSESKKLTIYNIII